MEELAVLLNLIEAHIAWPTHILYNIIVLMGKPTGGTRPIAFMPMLYRIWTKVRKPYLTEWESEHVGDWDAAIRGSSALREAALSQFHHEIAHYTEKDNGAILFDMAKFCDNIDIVELCTQASDTEYQPVLLALGMLMHMALRGIKAYNTHPGSQCPKNEALGIKQEADGLSQTYEK